MIKNVNMSIEAEFNRVKDEMRAATIERAQREVDNPELYFAPDAVQRELAWTIHALRRQFVELRAKLQSERAELVFIGCMAGQHRYCKKAAGDLRCACVCHQGGSR